MLTDREAMQQALEALEKCRTYYQSDWQSEETTKPEVRAAITALRARLAPAKPSLVDCGECPTIMGCVEGQCMKAPRPKPAQADEPVAMSQDDRRLLVEKAIKRAWLLGQTYFQQSDSPYPSQQRKADETMREYVQLLDETLAAIGEQMP